MPLPGPAIDPAARAKAPLRLAARASRVPTKRPSANAVHGVKAAQITAAVTSARAAGAAQVLD